MGPFSGFGNAGFDESIAEALLQIWIRSKLLGLLAYPDLYG